MTVDQSVVAFCNWTSISLAQEEEEEETVPGQEYNDHVTLLVGICISIGGVLILWLLYR